MSAREPSAAYGEEPAGAFLSRLRTIMLDVEFELTKAMSRFAPMNSPHEGHSVIREEFEELWKHVMADTGTTPAAREEAIQLAAMACRNVCDLCDSEGKRVAA